MSSQKGHNGGKSRSELDLMSADELSHLLEDKKSLDQFLEEEIDRQGLEEKRAGSLRINLQKNIRKRLKKAQKREDQLDDVSFLKGLEENIFEPEDLRIEAMQKGKRKKIGDLLEDSQYLARLKKTRKAMDKEAIFSPEQIKNYISLIRSKIQGQIESLEGISKEKSPELQLDMLHLQFEKILDLIDEISTYTDVTDDQKHAMKAFIVGQMMTGEGKKLDVGQALDQIEKLYNKIQGFLDPKAGKTKQTITKKWLKQGLELANEQIKSELKVKLKILHEESPWKHKSLDAEIEDFLGFGLNSDGSESYSRMISRALSEMKVAQFRQQMHKREKELNADASETEGAGKTESNQFFIDEAAENIKDAFLDFQKQRYTMERIIQELPSAIDNDSGIELEGHVADGTTKQQLTDAAHFLVHYEGWTRGEVRTAIGMALKSSSDIEFFLEQRKQEMLNKHCSKEERVRVQNSLNNDPKFDVFRYLNDRFDEERERQDAEEENETDRSNRYPYLEGEILNQVRKILDKMESLTQGDVDGYKKLQDELTSAVKGQEYLIEEAEERDGKATGSFVPRSVPKQYPQEEMMRINAIRYRHQHANKYKDLLKLKPKILQAALSSDAELQKVLVVLMFNAKDKGNEVLGQASKLAKVMSLKHPTTCIRFNAAKKEPFVNQDDSYQMLDKKGQWTATQPASFHERSTELIRMVQEKLKEGNYQGIEDLFKTGKAGDRLWSDARFFPVSKLQTEVERSQTGQPGEKGITYEIQLDQEGKSGKVLSSQIPKKLRSRFDGREFKALEKSMAKDQEYQDFRGLPPRLEDDEAFRRGFGTLTEHEIEKEIRTGTSVLGAGVFPDEPRPISEERIAELKKEWPLVAVRAQQLNSEMGGWALAAPQMGVRYVGDTLRQVAWDIPTTTLGLFAKDITFISPLSFIRSISEVIEHISALQNWKVQIQSYNLLKEVFKGTIWGAEFQKLYQAKDDERVNQFKSTFAAFGLDELIDKLYAPRDLFEFKAILTHGFEDKGLFTMEHLLTRDFIRVLNRYATSKVPDNFTDKEMQEDEDIRFTILQKIREGIDSVGPWGEGSFQSWKSAGASKFESAQKEAGKNFEGFNGADRNKVFTEYWKMLQTPDGKKKLRKRHPAEILGNIEEDMAKGWNDSGVTFAILQAMVCSGVINKEQFTRFQGNHVNDIPSYAVLDPNQAYNSGMTDLYEKKFKNLPFTTDNPFCGFFQGINTLTLKAKRAEGKWQFPESRKGFKKDEENGLIEEIPLTVHELQKNRQAQIDSIRKADNSCIQIYLPAYEYSEIEEVYKTGQDGEIVGDARPHDVVSAYRGLHLQFAAYMQSLQKKGGDFLTFKRNFFYAYQALAKSCGLAIHLSRYAGKEGDVDINKDGSPNLQSSYTEQRKRTGLTILERKVLNNVGLQQRMSDSSKFLDKPEIGLSPELRKAFKYMTGYQHVSTLGVNPITGKEDVGSYIPFDKMKFNPAKQFQELIRYFVRDAEKLADGNGYRNEFLASLASSGITEFSNNHKRSELINNWTSSEEGAKLP